MVLQLYGILELENQSKYLLDILDKFQQLSSSLEVISVVLHRLIRLVGCGILVLENVWLF